MKQSKLIRYTVAVLAIVAFDACGNKKPSATDVSETAETSDLIVSAVESTRETRDSVYYYWPGEAASYEYSVIELVFDDNKVLCGYLWGTTDEFDYAREGYLPGYMVVPMQDIKQKGDTLNFEIDTDGHEFYSAPVSIYIHDPVKEHCDSLHKWYVPSDNCWDTVKFTAVFNKKELSIIAKSKYWYWDDKPHVFHAYDRDSLAKILPPIPEDIEKINHGDGWFPVLNDSISTEE